MQSYFQRHKTLFVHLLFWFVYAASFIYMISFPRKGEEEPDWERVLRDGSFQVISMALISYFNYFILLPRFLKNQNFGRYLLEFLVIFSVFMFFSIHAKRYIIDGYTHQEKWVYSDRFLVQHIWGSLVIVLFVGMLKFAEDWFELEAKKREIENEKLTSELRFLKAQINPHFLFNTLNNLYYLAFTNSPNTPEVIDKLAQMMRYMMYDTNNARVPLSKEVDYMKNYISLEKLRLSEEIPIKFEVQGNTDTVSIAPLIFITFLENAFKHGVSSSAADAWVNVSIQLNGKACNYTVENSKMAETGKTVTEKSGIGLQNVKRRLDLSYPDNYELNVEETENRYAVELKLNLI
jgi:two-component system, LytTR family, sensor histidine kinase AlgZ